MIDGGRMDEEYMQYRIDQAHAYLERIRKMGDDCAALQAEVDDARVRATGVTGIDYTRDLVKSSPTDGKMADAVSAIRDAISDYVVKLAEFTGERSRASDALMLMDDLTEARVLRLRYLLDWKWEKVCTEMDYTWDGMMKLRRRALLHAYDVIPHSERDPMHPAI